MLPLYDIVAQPLYLFILNNPYNTARAGQEKCVHPPVRFLFAEQCGSFIAAQKCIKSTTTTKKKYIHEEANTVAWQCQMSAAIAFKHISLTWRFEGSVAFSVEESQTHEHTQIVIHILEQSFRLKFWCVAWKVHCIYLRLSSFQRIHVVHKTNKQKIRIRHAIDVHVRYMWLVCAMCNSVAVMLFHFDVSIQCFERCLHANTFFF